MQMGGTNSLFYHMIFLNYLVGGSSVAESPLVSPNGTAAASATSQVPDLKPAPSPDTKRPISSLKVTEGVTRLKI